MKAVNFMFYITRLTYEYMLNLQCILDTLLGLNWTRHKSDIETRP